ncbi:MAG: hypothetical protein HY231_07275 [Acidobacteria bacterium]|nr:hypothetical protein [Acidobacteriota bacterium]
MNRKTSIVLFLLIALAAIGATCEVNYSSAKISDATLAKEVNANKEAIDNTTSFDPAVPVIHCVVKLANAPEDTKLKAKWSIVNVAGEEPNTKMVESNIDAVGKNNILDFTFTPSGKGLPPGEYKVDVYLNPKDGDQPTKTLPFTIK